MIPFETNALKTDGIFYPPVPPRYRTPYFSHIMGGYSAGYYAYIWSEVLDANSVQWFKNNGGLTRANGDHFRKTLLSRGGSVDAMTLFRDFAGHDPVSYTHLDVYKRQRLPWRTGGSPLRRLSLIHI